jgi:uncharacterized membrane protein YqiK
VLVEGSYYINRLFATVEMVGKTMIEVGHVGVVISYTGADTGDTSGEDYRHGELVARGSRGVWSDPLLPGKYAFNTYAGKICRAHHQLHPEVGKRNHRPAQVRRELSEV